jgi:hypothetical protein
VGASSSVSYYSHKNAYIDHKLSEALGRRYGKCGQNTRFFHFFFSSFGAGDGPSVSQRLGKCSAIELKHTSLEQKGN